MPRIPGRESTRPEYDAADLLVTHFLTFVTGQFRCCVRGCGRMFDGFGRRTGGVVVLAADAGTGRERIVGEACGECVDRPDFGTNDPSLRHEEEVPTAPTRTDSAPPPEPEPDPRIAHYTARLSSIATDMEAGRLHAADLPTGLVERLLSALRECRQCRGAGCYRCCASCNADNHSCPGCGAPLSHQQQTEHGCCVDCSKAYR